MLHIEGDDVKTDGRGITSMKAKKETAKVTADCNPLGSDALRESLWQYYGSQAFDALEKGDCKSMAAAMNASLPYANPIIRCSEYLTYCKQEMGASLGFETIQYAYQYARCSGKNDVLENLEGRFVQRNLFSYAALALTLVAQLEKNAQKQKALIERSAKLEKQAIKKR
jgi:hypothetical protein